jgi:hypothetical protein
MLGAGNEPLRVESSREDFMNLRRVDLRNRIPPVDELEFLRADVPVDSAAPFVLVHYALHGREQHFGLRLDVHKAVFLDHFEDVRRDNAMRTAAPQIVALLKERHVAK